MNFSGRGEGWHFLEIADNWLENRPAIRY